jgi:hypothetical protein
LPAVSRFTANGLVRLSVVRALPPFDDRHVAPYPLIGEPLPLGGVNDTRSALPAIFVALTALGAAGAPMMIAVVAGDAAKIPPPFAAATVNVTDVPSVKPWTTVVVQGPKDSNCTPDPDGVTTYPWRQSASSGGMPVQLSVADPSPVATDNFVGAGNVVVQSPSPLAPNRLVEAGAEHGPITPWLFVSATWQVIVCETRFVMPETKIGLLVPVTVGSGPVTDDTHVTVNVAPGSPSPVKLTSTVMRLAGVTETFVGAGGAP